MIELTPPPDAIFIDWPRYPMFGKSGKALKNGGKPWPWLSMNAVNMMHPSTYRRIRAAWRQLVADYAIGHEPFSTPCRVGLAFHRLVQRDWDVGGLIEGAKPIIDGLTDVGLLPADSLAGGLVGIDILYCIKDPANHGIRIWAVPLQ